MSAIWAATLSLVLLQSVHGQEAGTPMPPGEGAIGVEMPVAFCSSSLENIQNGLLDIFRDGTPEVNPIINCLAFGMEGALETAIVSAFPIDGTPGTRFIVTCREDTITVVTSAQPARQFNITARDFQACAECDPNGVNILDICPENRSEQTY